MTASRFAPLTAVLTLAFAAIVGGWVNTAGRASAQQSRGQLQSTINTGQAHERTLSSAIARIDRLEHQTERSVSILQGRLNSAQSQLNQAETREQRTLAELNYQRRRAVLLAVRLANVRNRLAAVLRDQYENPPPDLVTVVFEARGFSQLLDTVDFMRRIQRADRDIVRLVRNARADARHERGVLDTLEQRQRAAAVVLRMQRNALAQIGAGLAERQKTLVQARAARQDALSAARASRIRAQTILTRLIAAQEKARVSNVGPGGPWAIPWAVVQCESGGQNTGLNWATASGYYQIIDSTWKGLGGSTQHAYQASKAEQDRLAAKLWNNGAGASNWVCAYIVGIV